MNNNKNIKFKGDKITLLGNSLNTGDKIPDFILTQNNLTDTTYSDYKGKVLIISVVPSLDTPVCSLQTKFFNKKATELSDNIVILTVSLDLPFALARFCGAEDIKNVITASDYKHRNFGENFGVLIKELGLLSRAIFIADSSGTLQYIDYVEEVGNEPDYESAIKALDNIK